jgi:arginine decarboxylase
MKDLELWSTEKSTDLYGLNNWGQGYFGVNKEGDITVHPHGKGSAAVSLYQLVRAVQERDIKLPVLFRFNDILRHRVKAMHDAFVEAIKEHEYQGSYFPAYPIKVNQQHHIVDVLAKANSTAPMGFEVGSKPELIAVLGVVASNDPFILCNGYKDEEYVELALMSRKIGRRTVVIIEKLTELELILAVAEKWGIEPEIGIRLRVAGKGAGRWEKSGGERAKFGLTISEILQCVEELERLDKTRLIKLLHFHLGSQLTSISSLRNGLKEAAQVYAQLHNRCPELCYLDVGGGLGVDYDGSKTNFESSMNYTMEEYARDVVWILDDVCAQARVPHPHIITESGRATVAYHSVLVFEVLGIANSFDTPCDAQKIIDTSSQINVQNMAYLLLELSPKNCQETVHDAMELRSDILQQFNLGLLSIEDRALADRCFWAVIRQACQVSKELHYVPKDLEDLPALLTDTYFCNLSVFQSLPDSWAIEQIFPITPVHRLNEEPTRRVVLADITCDSDGKIDRFADLREVKHYLPAHGLKKGEGYYFASYLVGAYQEILGDMHNLFGDTNAVHVDVDPDDGSFSLTNLVQGDSIREVLRFVQYEKPYLAERWRTAVEEAVRRGEITAPESAEIFKKYTNAFQGYTYLLSNKLRPRK